jgi:anti-anti-sigma factor
MMTDITVEVGTRDDGSLVIHPGGSLDAEQVAELRRTLVYAVRHLRPARLVLDLHDVGAVDPLALGTLAAACDLGDDQHVAVFLDNSSSAVAAQLTAAGVAQERLRHVAAWRA